MRKYLKPTTEFGRNIVKLLTGTTIAQAIPVLITPVLTRLYTPEEFGVFALFFSIVTIGALIATGRYEVAMMLPKSRANAKHLILLSLSISAVFNISLLVILFLYLEPIENVLGISNASTWIYLTPLSIFILSAYNIFNYWLSRNRLFQFISVSRVLQSTLISVVQLIIGLAFKLKSGLIISDVIGRVMTMVYIFHHIKKKDKFSFSKKRMMVLSARYKKFPIYELPASTFNSAAFQSPFFLIPIFFGTIMSGLYFLVFRVVMLPVSLIGSAFLEVFRVQSTEDMRTLGNCTKVFKKTLILLFLCGVPPTLILLIWAPELFAFIFGDTWYQAGIYAQILAPVAMIRLISSPLSYMFFLKEKLQLNLIFQMTYFGLIILSITVGAYYNSELLMFYLMSVSGIIFYSAQIVTSYYLSLSSNDMRAKI